MNAIFGVTVVPSNVTAFETSIGHGIKRAFDRNRDNSLFNRCTATRATIAAQIELR